MPLEQHVLVRSKLLDLFDTSTGLSGDRPSANADAARESASSHAWPPRAGGRWAARRQSDLGRHHARQAPRERPHGPRRRSSSCSTPRTCCPPIFFIFSRVGCDAAVQQVLRAGVRLTEQHERDEIRAIVEERCRTLLDEDLAVLGYWEWLDGLERGVAAHHAGMLPAFKEVVEELFQRKLVKVVFATETLALGINMPARTVVLEKLEKFNGEARVPITPGEYTQLTGRAGRRGIDVEGHSVIQWQDGLDPQAVASLASRRTYPLNSSFTPDLQHGRQPHRAVRPRAHPRDPRVVVRAVPGRPRRRRPRAQGAQQEESLAGYAKAMTCHLGDFAEYSGIRRELSDLERKSARAADQQSRAERDKRQRQLDRAAQAAEAAPLPRLPRPRGARALGRALVEAQAADG